MSITAIIFIVFLLTSLQPLLRQAMLDAARRQALHRLEMKRQSRVIALVHRQETISFLGIPLARYIDIEDSEQILRAIKLTAPDVPIDLILHTPGGLVLAAEQIAKALWRRKAPVTVFVPHYAMSGGTLIALAADQIIMDDNAVLGPVDPQLGDVPAASVLKVVEQKEINQIDDQTLIMADIARKALAQVKYFLTQLLGDRLPPEQARAVAETLAGGTWTHDYPISVDEARALGLPVSTDMPQDVYDIMSLFPQAPQRRPSVEYLPGPYAPPGRRAPAAPRR